METYKILFAIYCSLLDDDQAMVEQITNRFNPNSTVCPKCCVDDFQHVEGCELVNEIVSDEELRAFII